MLRRSPISQAWLLLLSCCVILLTTQLQSQTAVPDENGKLVFKANVRTVVLNIVVTSHDGNSIKGLHKQDFQVSEDGHAQTITFFEEHTNAHSSPTSEVNPAPLPPNVFTNVPRVPPSDAVTVLLLDSMNTYLGDQSVVHAQMLKYLQSVPPGTRMAIFTLGNSLQFIQGFTDDASLLSAALRDPKLGAGPQPSPLLNSTGQSAANAQAISGAAEHNSGAASALQGFLAEQNASRDNVRIDATLEALQTLAGYLAGIPGRKNVIWFSSFFPTVFFANPHIADSGNMERSFEEEVRKTDRMLAESQVAVYPIAAEGLATNAIYDASSQLVGVNGAAAAQQQLSVALYRESMQRNAAHATMDDIARETGGSALYNSNGLGAAAARIIDQGPYFYTLTYTPTNAAADGKYRKIHVKLNRESFGDNLAYRRGYYAANSKEAKAEAAIATGDPLHPYMGPGMPSTSQISFALRVERIAAQPGAGVPGDAPPLQARDQATLAKPAGDNQELKAPLTRYHVDFVVAASGLQLAPGADGSRHGKLEVTMLIYNREGQALNWLSRNVDLDLTATRYAEIKANGVNLAFEIDVPNGGVALRSGVFDLNADLAGTLEIPLSSIVSSAPNSHL
jgi:VWFA-related protein